MKPAYATLKRNYYSSNELAAGFVDAEQLFSEIGYEQKKLVAQNPGYVNTCAVRMSLALLKSGVSIKGRLPIKSGHLKGKYVEPGAKLLADLLAAPGLFGRPKIYTPENFIKSVNGKKGVVLFWKIAGYGGGHIDLIDVANLTATCNSACYFSSTEIWFWELK